MAVPLKKDLGAFAVKTSREMDDIENKQQEQNSGQPSGQKYISQQRFELICCSVKVRQQKLQGLQSRSAELERS